MLSLSVLSVNYHPFPFAGIIIVRLILYIYIFPHSVILQSFFVRSLLLRFHVDDKTHRTQKASGRRQPSWWTFPSPFLLLHPLSGSRQTSRYTKMMILFAEVTTTMARREESKMWSEHGEERCVVARRRRERRSDLKMMRENQSL